MKKDSIPIVIYDSNCGFCNSCKNFFQKRQSLQKLHFTAINSPIDMYFRGRLHISKAIESIVFINRKEKGDYYYRIKSDAIISIAKYLKFPWNLLGFLIIAPVFFRDYLYDLTAKNRFTINCTTNYSCKAGCYKL